MERLGKSLISVAAVFFVPAILKLAYGFYTVISFSPRREWSGYTGWDAAAESFSIGLELFGLALVFMAMGGLLVAWHERRQLQPVVESVTSISGSTQLNDYMEIEEYMRSNRGEEQHELQAVDTHIETQEADSQHSSLQHPSRKKQKSTEKVA